ncbi:MAG: hypothetical protein AAF557_02095 [Pseudomonadota bacterium]
MKRLIAVVLMLANSAASPICAEPKPTVMPSCTVGVWAGTNDMLEKMRAIMASMPATVRANMESRMTQPLSMTVFEDGYYATMPVNRGIIADVQHDNGDVTQLTMDLAITSALGWLWAEDDGRMGFCSEPGTGQFMMSSTAQNPHGSATAAVGPTGGGDFVPEMTYQCAGDQMTMQVMLPAPVGMVTYTMTRVPENRWSEAFRDAHARRFASE